MQEILNNPIVKMWLNKNFKSYLEANKIDGIYLSLDEKGNICLTDYKTKPNDTAGND